MPRNLWGASALLDKIRWGRGYLPYGHSIVRSVGQPGVLFVGSRIKLLRKVVWVFWECPSKYCYSGTGTFNTYWESPKVHVIWCNCLEWLLFFSVCALVFIMSVPIWYFLQFLSYWKTITVDYFYNFEAWFWIKGWSHEYKPVINNSSTPLPYPFLFPAEVICLERLAPEEVYTFYTSVKWPNKAEFRKIWIINAV